MRRALLAWPLLEVLAIWGMVTLIGWGWTLLVLLACIPVGFAVMRSAGANAFAELQQAGRLGLPPGRGSEHALRFAAGLLIAIPGPVTTVAGLLLLTPLGRRAARSWLSARFTVLGTTNGSPTGPHGPTDGDVVRGEVIVEHDPDMRQGPSRHPELGP